MGKYHYESIWGSGAVEMKSVTIAEQHPKDYNVMDVTLGITDAVPVTTGAVNGLSAALLKYTWRYTSL